MDPIKDEIQKYLDEHERDGWTVTQYVIAMGLSRIDSDGNIESIAWYHAPQGQADWQTQGLLHSAVELSEAAEAEAD